MQAKLSSVPPLGNRLIAFAGEIDEDLLLWVSENLCRRFRREIKEGYMRSSIGLGRALVVAVVAAVGLAGCGAEFNAYDGSVQDVARVATVRGDVNTGNVIIISFNGKSTLGTWKAPTSQVRVLPGIHKFGVKPKTLDFRRILRFRVMAGREYLVLFSGGAFDVEEVTGRKVDFVESES